MDDKLTADKVLTLANVSRATLTRWMNPIWAATKGLTSPFPSGEMINGKSKQWSRDAVVEWLDVNSSNLGRHGGHKSKKEMRMKLLQLTSFGGNREDYLPWYSRYFLVSGEGLNFDEPIFATIEAKANAEDYFDHVNDVLDALRAAGYTIQDVDTPISFAADDWGDM